VLGNSAFELLRKLLSGDDAGLVHLGERSGLDLGPDTEQRLAMHAVYVQEYDIVDAGRVRRVQNGSAGRT
jgi:hypothetical protein